MKLFFDSRYFPSFFFPIYLLSENFFRKEKNREGEKRDGNIRKEEEIFKMRKMIIEENKKVVRTGKSGEEMNK